MTEQIDCREKRHVQALQVAQRHCRNKTKDNNNNKNDNDTATTTIMTARTTTTTK